MALEVNLVNLLDVLQKVTDVDNLGLHLSVSKHELDKIRQDFYTTDERKMKMLQWWLDHTPNPTWEMVTSALRAIGKPKLADAVALVSKRESLYELCEEDLQTRKEIYCKESDKNLQAVLERSQHLEEEWEKGEKEWREYLINLKKIEEHWEDLVKAQQTRKAHLTLGISWLFPSKLESLQQTDVLVEKLQQHVERSKKLRDFYGRAREHRGRLQNTETELEEWAKALIEHEVELQEHIDQMKELGEKFSGETKECKKQLVKIGERLQTCREKMRECRDELTKSQRQLEKCQRKLTECEVNLKRCRDELENSHSQITNCIESLKKKSVDLSGQVKALTITAGGVGGAAGGAGAVGAGAGIGAAIGVVGGPIGITGGIAIGAVAGVVSLAYGILKGHDVANRHENRMEETREKLRECEHKLNDCGNVVERCREVLRKSEEELKELKTIVSGLDETFYGL